MAYSVRVTLLLSFFIPFASLNNADATWSSKTLEEICNSVNEENWNQTFCIKALESEHRILSAKNLVSLAIGIIETGISNATNTRAYMKDKLQHDYHVEPLYKEALNYCVDQYNEAINSFHSALLEVKDDKDYMTPSYDVRMAEESAYYCNKTLVSLRVDAPSVDAGNKFVRYFAAVADEVVNRLWGQVVGPETPIQIPSKSGERTSLLTVCALFSIVL